MSKKKFSALVALLGIAQMELHANFFGKKSFAKIDEEQLETIENALQNTDSTELKQKIQTLEKEKETLASKVSEMEQSQKQTENALEQALSANGLTPKESVVESIVMLGEKCKEYGDADPIHTLPKNDGKSAPEEDGGLVEGFYDPNAPHNQID